MTSTACRYLPAELVIGLPELDAQHEALFARLDYLKMLFLETNRLPAAQAEALLIALREHHATEERLAAEMQRDFAEDVRQHEVMLRAVTKTLKEVVEGRMSIFGLLRYLEYWFERHIAEEDRAFALHPRAAGTAAPVRRRLLPAANYDEQLAA